MKLANTTTAIVKKFSILAVTTTAIALGAINSVQAAAVTFEGNLSFGSTQTGAVPGGDNTGNPSEWKFWSFSGNAGDIATVTVRRAVAALDPAFGVWFGTEADTSDYTDIFADGATTPLVAIGDDDLPPAIPAGLWGDSEATFTLPNSGLYTIAVASFASDPSTKPLRYNISVQYGEPVPEPITIAGTLLAGGIGVVLKRKKSQATSNLEG
ncbi:PEP-CTERM sorting domain-containing protein [Chlorogloeopsis sp. ULAP02]|uniref:PEP-CTERM sorting domain-containing protein n=1 Tax=Chlorogloeopsis sp. ULAP02 TaxID=3107926 RepID=UPI003134FD1A